MFYEVRVKRPDGTVKDVLSGQQLSKIYWDQFWQNEESIRKNRPGSPNVSESVRQTLDVMFPDPKDEEWRQEWSRL